MPAIVIIVPVYNAEKYLRRCVDSLLHQTFADFALFLVDDGSTDSSGTICDEYAAKDGRVTVIHQENKGQGAARNAALDDVFAHDIGQWITFVDSDDWVDTRYLEMLLSAALKGGTSISACGFTRVKGQEETPDAAVGETNIMSAEDFYCKEKVLSDGPWAKLFAKELWRHFRFAEGVIHEDTFVIYKVLFESGSISMISTSLYRYFYNVEGTVHSPWTPARLSILQAKKEQIQYMEAHAYERAFRKAIAEYARQMGRQIELTQGMAEYKAIRKDLRRQLRKTLFHYHSLGLIGRRHNIVAYSAAFPLEMRVVHLLWLFKNTLFKKRA